MKTQDSDRLGEIEDRAVDAGRLKRAAADHKPSGHRITENLFTPSGKRIAYESGIDPVGGDWAQAQIRYYVYAYLYVLFAVEAVFLFPWAVVFDRPGFGLLTVAEMGVFVAVLALGIVYAWRKKILTWT